MRAALGVGREGAGTGSGEEEVDTRSGGEAERSSGRRSPQSLRTTGLLRREARFRALDAQLLRFVGNSFSREWTLEPYFSAGEKGSPPRSDSPPLALSYSGAYMYDCYVIAM